MKILILSNSEHNSFTTICDCILNMPRDVDWKILGNSKFHPNLISLFGENRFIDIPIPKLSEYVHEENKPFNFLNEELEDYIVVPTDFQSLKFLSKNRKSFNGNVVCPLMEHSMLLYLDDKLNVNQIADDCNVRSPKEYAFSELEKLPTDHRIVMKPHFGDGSNGVFISENKQGAIQYYEQLAAEKRQAHVIQDYIAGDDYYYYAICHTGRVLVRGILRPGRFKHFGTYFANDASIDDCAKRIVERYRYSGPISIDFRMDKTREVYLIEINPRNGNNAYLFNIARTNWLFELAKMAKTPRAYATTHHIMNRKWMCFCRMPLLYFFYKLKIYKAKFLFRFVVPVSIFFSHIYEVLMFVGGEFEQGLLVLNSSLRGGEEYQRLEQALAIIEMFVSSAQPLG